LVRVTTRKSVRAMDVKQFHSPICNLVPEFLQGWASQGGPTESLIDVNVVRKHDVAIGCCPLFESCYLAFHGRLLRLSGDDP
jgi:hypothetical protein